jgi:hypothetical protein
VFQKDFSKRLEAAMRIDRCIVGLQRKNSQTNVATTDSTVFIVLALILVSQLLGELGPAKKHLKGLYDLLQLHGGVTALSKKLL